MVFIGLAALVGAILSAVCVGACYRRKMKAMAADVYQTLDLTAALICAEHTRSLPLTELDGREPTPTEEWGWDSEDALIRYRAWAGAANEVRIVLKDWLE